MHWRPNSELWGGTDLPPAGQYGENLTHQFNGSIATDPTISG